MSHALVAVTSVKTTKPKQKVRGKQAVTRRAILALFATPVIDRASLLDREADVALSHGHHLRAERLAWRAAELRGWSE